MTVHLPFGAWSIPLAITIVLLVWAAIPRSTDRRSGDWDFTFWIPAAKRLVGAIIGSLVAWLVWSLMR